MSHLMGLTQHQPTNIYSMVSAMTNVRQEVGTEKGFFSEAVREGFPEEVTFKPSS